MTSKEVAANHLYNAVYYAAAELVRDIERGDLSRELAEDLNQATITENREKRIANEVRKMMAPFMASLSRKGKFDYTPGPLEPK